MKKIIFSEKSPAPIGAYSQAVQAGNTLYVSGQIALDTQGNLHTQDVETETKQVMENLKNILEKASMGFENVVKCSIFLKNMSDFAKVNGIYGQYFTENPPARETVEVSQLPRNVNVEISCIAVNQ